MGVLRTLALLLGRAFQHLARMLLSWSRVPVEGSADPTDGADSPDDGPPEHWLKYVGQRAPWIVRRIRPVLRAPERPAAVEPGELGPGSVPAQRPAAAGASVYPTGDGPPAAAPLPLPVSGTSVLGSGSARAAGPHAPAATPLETWAARPGDPPASPATRAVPAVPQPVPMRRRALAAAQATEPDSTARRPAAPERVIQPGPVRFPDESPGPGPVSRIRAARATGEHTSRWPPLEREAPPTRGERAAEKTAMTAVPPVWAAPRAGSRAFPEPVPEDREDGAARASPDGEPDIPEEDRWPELPNTGWGEDTWQGPSSRSLVREQLRLNRLLAEQAGSSWSGPRS
jgi:hypothetical protein